MKCRFHILISSNFSSQAAKKLKRINGSIHVVFKEETYQVSCNQDIQNQIDPIVRNYSQLVKKRKIRKNLIYQSNQMETVM
jgi:hypothetical protein